MGFFWESKSDQLEKQVRPVWSQSHDNNNV